MSKVVEMKVFDAKFLACAAERGSDRTAIVRKDAFGFVVELPLLQKERPRIEARGG